jgi:membrane protein DedA with SNARE-associated domain
MTQRQYRWLRRAGIAVAVLAAISAAWFSLRSYRTFLLLQSAYEVGLPQSSALRAWMTLEFVATTYRIPEADLRARLSVPSETRSGATLRSLAEGQGIAPFEYVQRVQRAIADAGPTPVPPSERAPPTWLERLNDDMLSALLRHGYSILALTLLLGAVGLPMPAAISAMIAGSLSAAGSMSWLAAGLIAIAASVGGDAIAYGLGHSLSAQFLARRGRWFGMTSHRQARARDIFDHWGGATVLITRTLVSHLSSVVSLLAGISRYRLPAFLSFALVGRILWTAAYMGLGFAIGGSLEAAAGFLKNLSGLLASLAVLAGGLLLTSGVIGRGADKK